MPYRFKLDEDFAKGVRRIVTEQIDRAATQLSSERAGVGVHETRKCLKRVRALLWLVRTGLGKATFTRENQRFGDIGRMLSKSRDQTVLRATLDLLTSEHPEHSAVLRSLKRSVPDPAKNNPRTRQRLADKACRQLGKARSDWAELELKADGFASGLETIGQGLSRTLAEVRSAMERASDDDEAVHDWRKAVQRHWRHMHVLRAGWQQYFEARAAEARSVSELLGSAQDLTLLIEHARREAGRSLTAAQADVVTALALDSRKAFRTAAWDRCLRLVAEGPDGHARRAQDYWRAARGIASNRPADNPAELAQGAEALAAARDGLRSPVRKAAGRAGTGRRQKPGTRSATSGRTGPHDRSRR